MLTKEKKIPMEKKIISVLGSTGSIGTQTLDICRKNMDLYCIEGITTNKNIKLLIQQIIEFMPKKVCIFDYNSYKEFIYIYSNILGDNNKISNIEDKSFSIELERLISDEDMRFYRDLKSSKTLPTIEVYHGLDGLIEISKSKNIDILVTAVVGMIGLLPTIEAIKNSTTIALANKETLVTAGEIVMSEAKKYNAQIIPVDSEHSAIFQCMNGDYSTEIDKILLTASGGPFRGKKREELINITKNEALKHPNWSMGQKITIDSSTLMNKGLEVIEARWLFDVEPEDIVVHVHPQSIVHSMVQYKDSSIIAQLGCPDMRVPIQYALTYPKRMEGDFEKLDLFKISTLTFEKPDLETFPCLGLAYRALREGGTSPAVLNAANEVLVEKFLKDEIGFYDIPKYIEIAINKHEFIEKPNLNEIIDADKWTRGFIKSLF